MPKLFLTSALKDDRICAAGDAVGVHCQSFLGMLTASLSKNNMEYFIGHGTLEERVEQCQGFMPDVYYAFCTAESARHDSRFSALTVYSTAPSSPSYRAAERIRRRRELVYPRSVFIHQNKQDPEILRINAPVILDRIIFHDHPQEAIWFHKNMQLLAESVTAGLCDYFKLPFCGCLTEKMMDYSNKYQALLAELETLLIKFKIQEQGE